MKKKSILHACVAAMLSLGLCGCDWETESEVVSREISLEADNFGTTRRLTVINTRTDTVLMTMEGRLSIEDQSDRIIVLAQIDKENEIYKKNFVYKTPHTFIVVEDMTGAEGPRYSLDILPEDTDDVVVK